MALSRIQITDATDAEIADFCKTQQLENIPAGRTKMLALLQSVWPDDFIFVSRVDASALPQMSAPVAEPQVSAESLVGGIGKDDPKWIVLIAETETPGGKDPVPVAVNGRCVVLQRNLRIELPHRFKLALDAAIRTVISQTPAASGFGYDTSDSHVPNYPFSILGMPRPEEIAAWHERVDAEVFPA